MKTTEELKSALETICPEGWLLSEGEDGTLVLSTPEDDVAYSFYLEEGEVPILYARTEVCELPKTNSPALLYESLLAGNFFWRETDGASLSVKDDSVYLTERIEAEHVAGAEGLNAFANGLAAARAKWIDNVALGEAPGEGIGNGDWGMENGAWKGVRV